MILTKEEIKREISHLYSLLGGATLEEKVTIYETIFNINDRIHPEIESPLTLSETINNAFNDMAPTSFLWPIICEFAKINEPDFPYYTIPTIDLSNEELLDATHEFFKNATDKKTYNIFLHFWKKGNTLIQFTDDILEYANVFYFPYFKKANILMSRKNEFQDLPTMSHEYGHLIQFYINYSDHIHSTLKPFSEISSTFFELIAADYFIKTKSFSLGTISQAEEMVLRINEAQNISKGINFFNQISKKYLSSKQMIKRKIENLIEKGNEDKLTEIFLDLGAGNDYNYIISFIIACNLYMMYLQDPEKAFYTLYKLFEIDLRLYPEDYFSKLKDLNITGIEGSYGYMDELNRKLKKL